MAESPRDQTSPPQMVVVSPLTVRSPDYRAIYANQIQVATTPFDFQLTLSRTGAPGGTPVNEMQATVFLSPGEAKVLQALMNKVITDFEAQFGVISVPQHLLTPAPLPAVGVAS